MFQAAIVSKVTLKKNWDDYTDSYISVLPGGGKTSIVCWCAKVIEEIDSDLRIYVVTTEEHLLGQLRDFGSQFDLLRTTFIEQKNLHLITTKAVVIFDEYYHALWKSKLTIKDGVIQGVLGLRRFGARRILLGGTAGHNFKNLILPKLFDKAMIVDKFKSVFDMLGMDVFSNHTVKCSLNAKEHKKQMIAYVAERAKENPVVVIGEEDLYNSIRKLVKNPRIPVYYCEDLKKVQELRDKTESMTVGVVVLHKVLGYGTDIRFTGHP